MPKNYRQPLDKKWKPNDEEVIKRTITALMDIMTFDESGNAQTSEFIKLSKLLRILIHYLKFPEIISHEWDLMYNLTYKVAFQIKKSEIQDISQFQELLSKEVELYLIQPINEYFVLLPLHAIEDSFADKSKISLMNNNLIFRHWDTLKEEMDIDSFIKKGDSFLKGFVGKKLDRINELFTPIIIRTDGRNEEEAFSKAERVFDLLRIILNLLYVQYRFNKQFGGYPKEYSKCLPPPLYGIFKPNGEFISIFYCLSIYPEYKENKITEEYIEGINKIIGLIHEPENDEDSMRLFIDGLEIYGQAIDTSEWRLSFIYLWQFFELLTLKSKDKLSEKDVVSRVSNILNLSQEDEDLLQVMYCSRNSLVHESKYPNGNTHSMDEFSFLKSLVDKFIGKSYDLVIKYPTISLLSSFYKKSSSPCESISA